MLPTSSKKIWISEKTAYTLTNSGSIKTIVSTAQTRIKWPGLGSRGRLGCARELGSTRINIANIKMSGDQNGTIIKGGIKIFFDGL